MVQVFVQLFLACHHVTKLFKADHVVSVQVQLPQDLACVRLRAEDVHQVGSRDVPAVVLVEVVERIPVVEVKVAVVEWSGRRVSGGDDNER